MFAKTPQYVPPTADLWTGRAGDPQAAPQYWFQVVQYLDWSSGQLPALPKGGRGVALLGYAVDEGVRRNQGRPGAAEGPVAIRRQIARLAWHFDSAVQLLDVGDVRCMSGDLAAAQGVLAKAVTALLAAGYFPLVLGGGHDIAYGHFRGLQAHCAQAQLGDRIGIVNFDAHFDLRRPTNGPNSGTAFYQLANTSASPADFRYCVVGIQQAANPPELFAIAQEYQVEVIPARDVHPDNLTELRQRLSAFAERCDHLYITIDLDGFSAAYAPGVSAPSPMGFTPAIVSELLTDLFATGKVMSLDIAELNPHYDLDDRTARLAARLVYGVVGELL